MKIVYRSFDGRYSDNPPAVYEALLSCGDGAEHVWVATSGHAHEFPPDVETVPEEGPDTVRALQSADLVVSNTHLSTDWTKRPGTTYPTATPPSTPRGRRSSPGTSRGGTCCWRRTPSPRSCCRRSSATRGRCP